MVIKPEPVTYGSITINYHETATNSITDLTGTKWYFNESINISVTATYGLNFTSNLESYTSININFIPMPPPNDPLVQFIYNRSNLSSEAYSNTYPGWSNEAFRTIEITGGTDATNATLISWLQANATQIQDESNPISFGNLPIANMYFGTQQVKKVYLGNTLLWKSAAEPTPTNMPSKGDIITLDSGTARYRVLKTRGAVAEVLALDDVANSLFNSSSVTTTFSDGSTGQKYENSNLDTYMNSTFYNSLSANIKAAIVQKAITQSIYQLSTSEISGYDFAMTLITSETRWYKRKGEVSVGNRYCYALDLDDVAEYLGAGSGNTVSGADLNDMLFEQTTAVSKTVWFSSAGSGNSTFAFYVYGNSGYVNLNYYVSSSIVRPAFQVDLSKVSWVKE